jgi:hypothetical protein
MGSAPGDTNQPIVSHEGLEPGTTSLSEVPSSICEAHREVSLAGDADQAAACALARAA